MGTKHSITVLHILNGLNVGGAEAFLKNLSLAFSDDGVQMDFLLRSEVNDSQTVKFFEDRGSKITIMPTFPLKAMSNYRETAHYLKQCSDKYDVVHIHANSLFYYFPIVAVQKYMPDSKIVVHSHNSDSKSRLVKQIHNINKKRLKKQPIARIACSHEAGEWMFGTSHFKTVNNGIDLYRFHNSESTRGGYRQQYHINYELLICVGRLVPEKNHKFLFPVVNELRKKHPQIRLIICGDGVLKEELQEAINKENLSNNICLLGNRTDVPELLKMSDVYLMPSMYEGLSFSAIEAQASGIPCVLSNNISQDTKLCSNISMIPLKQELWVKEIERAWQKRSFQYNSIDLLEQAGYGLKTLRKRMLKIYLGE